MTRPEFAEAMAYLQAGIGREFSAVQLEVWFDTLGQLQRDDVGYAVRRYLAEAKSAFPMPAQLLEFAAERRYGETLDHGAAFANVMKAVREFGSYQPDKGMVALDAATQAAVRACGGFLWFCEMEANNRSTMAAQFRMAYQQTQEKHERDRRLPKELRCSPRRRHLPRRSPPRGQMTPELGTGTICLPFLLPFGWIKWGHK